MAAFTISKRIESSPDQVFRVCTDFANMANVISGIVKIEILTDGPVGVGTRFRETRIMFKKEATEEMEVTAFEPGKSFTLEATSCGSRCIAAHHFSADGSGTNMQIDFEFRSLTFFAKLMSPLGWLMMGSMKKCIEKDLDDVKKAAEEKVPAE